MYNFLRNYLYMKFDIPISFGFSVIGDQAW